MYVIKRGNRGHENIKLDKITTRITNLCSGLSPLVDTTQITLRSVQNIHSGITTEELDKITAKVAESMKTIHPDYSTLASRILVSNMQKSTPKSFSGCISLANTALQNISPTHYSFVMRHAAALDNMVVDANDYLFDYLGYQTLESTYLMYQTTATQRGAERKLIDRPQYMFMRVAVALYMESDTDTQQCLENIKICYKALSQMYFIHATPTLFNAMTHKQQMLSCFLLGTDDSIEGIMGTLANTSYISKWSGGIGIHMHCIRGAGQYIQGTNGKSSGLIPQLQMYNAAAKCWDQGGKRLGAFAIYIEPWHSDIIQYLQLKLQQGAESERARNLFYAIWVPDLFVKRAKGGEKWSLFSEDTHPGLSSVYDGMEVCKYCGYCSNKDYLAFMKATRPEFVEKFATCIHEFHLRDMFTELYTMYESEGTAVKTVDAQQILNLICEAQRDSGVPYVCFKDHANRKSNQKNVGTVKSSNLCAEIYEWSSNDSYACCTLVSINLKKYVRCASGFDHEMLHRMTRLVVRNLNRVIDINIYPVDKCQDNNLQYRPIGIGIQGLANVFAMLKLPFLSDEAKTLDLEIAETIYHAALTESCELAKTHGPYSSFAGSPASKGLLQYHLWMEGNSRLGNQFAGMDPRSTRYDWCALERDVMQYGIRNSLMIANMPTVSTSQLCGNNESFEPFANNIYTKTTLTGKHMVTNHMLIRELINAGVWNDELKNAIINADGSVQGMELVPKNIRDVYQTVWELKQSELMTRTALRGAFIDQGQSLNIHLRDNSNATLRGVFQHGYELGLKTGSYYIRTQPTSKAMKNNITASKQLDEVCEVGCTSCSS